jgi:hypothetical protein
VLPAPDIIIVTQKSEMEIAPLRVCVEGFSMDCNVYVTCRDGSVAQNRNYGLSLAKTPVVIMMDDAVQGFYRGWWRELIVPMESPLVALCAARLVSNDGAVILCPFSSNDLSVPVEYVAMAPLALCAFRNTGVQFGDDSDGAFVARLKARNEKAQVVINNQCKMAYAHKLEVAGGIEEHRKPTEIVVR